MVGFESRADRIPDRGGRGRRTTARGRGGRPRHASPDIRTSSTPQDPPKLAPKGSPIMHRLTRPAAPVWTSVTPAQATIHVRPPYPPPSAPITRHVVMGHVKKPRATHACQVTPQAQRSSTSGPAYCRRTLRSQLPGSHVLQPTHCGQHNHAHHHIITPALPYLLSSHSFTWGTSIK